jgi:predicted P-loop ATPase
LTNARVALSKLDMPFTHDLFKNKKYVGRMALTTDVGGQVSDEALTALRVMVRHQFKFDPGKNNTWDATNMLCREHAYHPVKDYLESLTWDGVPRIEMMLTNYFGAPDTPFVRGVSLIVMIASVRRIYDPGCKFDYMTVLESPEGYAKSSALAKLYGAEFFSDQTILGLDDKQLAETLRGRWCIECADLSGMRKAEVEKIKAQLSRFEDRTRPAYGRAVIDAPRSCIFWGTTNELEYLRSQTGNRRFFPVPVGRINVKAIERDRDQLWAEAMVNEPMMASIMLPEALWAAAGKEQEARTYQDTWLDVLADVSSRGERYEAARTAPGTGGLLADTGPAEYERRDGRERVTSAWLLTDVLRIPEGQQNAEHGKRLGMVMRKLGWKGPKGYQIDGRVARGYERETWE